jgi:hypothetical protein
MKRALVGLGLVLATSSGGSVVSAGDGAPPGLLKKGTEVYHCTNGDTVNVVGGGGRSGINADTGQRYLLREIEVTAPGFGVVYAKSYGDGPSGPSLFCESDGVHPKMGPYHIEVEVVAVR